MSVQVALLGTLLLSSTPLAAQAPSPLLVPKRSLSTGPATGCAMITTRPVAGARRDNPESRRLAAAGREAALIGDHATARDAFARATALNPGDERLAYDLARTHEALNDSATAVIEFCRYLALMPDGTDAADVRDRLHRLVPLATKQQATAGQAAFRLGLSLYDDGLYEAAARAFGDVVKLASSAPEGYFNRGLAHAASRARGEAMRDLDTYRTKSPAATDLVEVGRAIDVLRRPVYSRGGAITRGIVPGFGQFYTGRPVRGVLVLALAGGATALAFTQQSSTTTVMYVDPNGNPAPYTETTRERPYLTTGLVAAGAITVLGMIDAMITATRSQREATIIPHSTRRPERMSATPRLTVRPTLDPERVSAGVAMRMRF